MQLGYETTILASETRRGLEAISAEDRARWRSERKRCTSLKRSAASRAATRPCAVGFPHTEFSPWHALPMAQQPRDSLYGKAEDRPLVDAAMLDPAYVVAWAQMARGRLAARFAD